MDGWMVWRWMGMDVYEYEYEGVSERGRRGGSE